MFWFDGAVCVALDPATAADLGRRLGHDFSTVRIHRNDAAAAAFVGEQVNRERVGPQLRIGLRPHALENRRATISQPLFLTTKSLSIHVAINPPSGELARSGLAQRVLAELTRNSEVTGLPVES